MSSRGDRRRANAALVGNQLKRARVVVPCLPPPAPIQFLDVRVRDTHAGNVPVPGVQVTVTDPLGGHAPLVGNTDQYGDVIFAIPAAGVAWDVTALKDWFIPEPALQAGVVVAARAMPVVNLVLEELRYYLHVDADRDGDVDDQHEGLNVITPWAWRDGQRGAIMLCNNDHDDGLAVALRNPDNQDAVVNNGNDGTHELAPLQIRRVGPNTAPPAATNWQATLAVLNGDEDKIRIFAGMAAGDAQVIGAAHGGGGAVINHAYPLRIVGPASMPTTTLGMEATTYPKQGFDGVVQVQLTVTKQSVFGGAVINYTTAAEIRVAPWLLPNHLDEARRVYVVDLGADVMAGPRLAAGNQTFRANLGLGLNAAGIAGGDFVEHAIAGVAAPHRDRWMQDCMEIGYSVLPKNTGGATRHRIESVMQAYRDFGLSDLKSHPRLLLDQDFGFHFQAGASEAAGYVAALAGGLGASNAFNNAEAGADDEINRQGFAAHPGALAAATAVATAVEAALAAGGSVQAAKANMILQGTNAMIAQGMPFSAPAVAQAVAEEAAEAAAAAANTTTTFDSCGNLECTPPCRAGAAAAAVGGVAAANKDFPWGRVYYGRGLAGAGQPFNPNVRQFLEKQHVQLPIAINTDWLEVGHVDEMMSFIPAPGPPLRQWRLLLASPRRAFQLMDPLNPATPILVGRQLPLGGAWTPVNSTVGVLRNGAVATPIPYPGRVPPMTGAELRGFNTVIQGVIDTVANQLVNEIGVVLAEIIHVPTIFIPGHTMAVAGALTADMVNMLVVNNRLIIPKPFGPIDMVANTDVFETALRADIVAANPALHVRYVDDWYTYHANMGEIHCGTNTNRRPANMNAWLATQAAEWWRFDG